MNTQELDDADRDINTNRQETVKTAFLTSVQAFLRLFMVSAIIFLMGDWLLNRDVRHTLVGDNLRTVTWIEDHKQDFLKLLIATAKHDTKENLDNVTATDMRESLNDLQARLRRVESAVSVIQSINHNGVKR